MGLQYTWAENFAIFDIIDSGVKESLHNRLEARNLCQRHSCCCLPSCDTLLTILGGTACFSAGTPLLVQSRQESAALRVGHVEEPGGGAVAQTQTAAPDVDQVVGAALKL